MLLFKIGAQLFCPTRPLSAPSVSECSHVSDTRRHPDSARCCGGKAPAGMSSVKGESRKRALSGRPRAVWRDGAGRSTIPGWCVDRWRIRASKASPRRNQKRVIDMEGTSMETGDMNEADGMQEAGDMNEADGTQEADDMQETDGMNEPGDMNEPDDMKERGEMERSP